MSMWNGRSKFVLIGMIFFLCGSLLYAARDGMAAQRSFTQKDCLACHKKFADTYLGMKYLHPLMKEHKCEECHLRHGIVPKLLLRKEGNELCYSCHAKEKIGMN